MHKSFSLEILDSNKSLYKGEVVSLVVPAALGYLGVLANHAPLVASLTSGKISLRDSFGKTEVIPSESKGFLEVANNKAVIILDSPR